MSSRRASLSSQQLRSAGFFCGRPCDMELVTRQYERPGHQQRLLQTFTEDVFIFTCVHSALELTGRCALQIHLLTYSFKAHWRQYCFVRPTRHDLVLSWLFRPLEQHDINLLNLLTYCILSSVPSAWNSLPGHFVFFIGNFKHSVKTTDMYNYSSRYRTTYSSRM